jgi:hypothetical protein
MEEQQIPVSASIPEGANNPGADIRPVKKKKNWIKRNMWKVWLFLFLALAISGYFKYYYVYSSDSSISGKMQKISRKGFVFKTWEGYLYTMVAPDQSTGMIAPKEWTFSVTNDSIANVLETYVGKNVILHYHQLLGTLPWRGDSKYIVHAAELFK